MFARKQFTKMWKELLARGVRVGKERVRKLMQRHGIKARGKNVFTISFARENA